MQQGAGSGVGPPSHPTATATAAGDSSAPPTLARQPSLRPQLHHRLGRPRSHLGQLVGGAAGHLGHAQGAQLSLQLLELHSKAGPTPTASRRASPHADSVTYFMYSQSWNVEPGQSGRPTTPPAACATAQGVMPPLPPAAPLRRLPRRSPCSTDLSEQVRLALRPQLVGLDLGCA